MSLSPSQSDNPASKAKIAHKLSSLSALPDSNSVKLPRNSGSNSVPFNAIFTKPPQPKQLSVTHSLKCKPSSVKPLPLRRGP